jgi:4-hydroxy-3-polyprenylbenzoate decarboxylase
MTKLSDAGVIVLPANPGFYHRPKNIEEMVAHIAGKILDQFDIEHDVYRRWK